MLKILNVILLLAAFSGYARDINEIKVSHSEESIKISLGKKSLELSREDWVECMERQFAKGKMWSELSVIWDLITGKPDMGKIIEQGIIYDKANFKVKIKSEELFRALTQECSQG